MDLRQLNALLAVAEHHSFSAAARALHTVQSNVSTHVARLEQELGSVLIDRARGDLTPEGTIVADRARRILSELRAIEDDLVSLRDDVSGSVRAGVIGTTARWLVPALLNTLNRSFPRVDLKIIAATTTSLIPQLVSDRLDVAVINLPVDDPDVDTSFLFEEDRVLIAPAGHPLAERGQVTLAEIAAHEILLPPPGTAFRDEIDTDADRARLALQAKAEVDGLQLMASLAFQGFAPAIVPASAIPAAFEGDWRRVEIDELHRRLVGLAIPRRATPSAPTRVVVDAISQAIETYGPGIEGIRIQSSNETTGATA